MVFHILRPSAEDFSELTDICIKQTKHWGYPDCLIESWKDELTITPRFIRHSDISKIVDAHNKILGFGALFDGDGAYEIKHLCVLPEVEKMGIAKFLLDTLERKVENKRTIKVIPDPHAMPFFQKYGYYKVEDRSKD
jgi:GNAT superfamily N-acetyltransferase